MVMPRFRRPPVSLTISTPRREPQPVGPEVASAVPWFVAAVLGGIASVAAGWAAVAVVVSAAWLTATRTPLAALVDTVGQGWLAAHGAQAVLGDVRLGVVPLGLTALAVTAVAVATHWAGLHLRPVDARWRDLAALVVASSAAYVVAALVLASLVGTPSQATAAFAGAAGIGLVGSLAGGLRALALDPLAALPDWVRHLPGAIGVGVASLAAGSALALVVGLVQRWDRVLALHQSLAPDALGTVLLVLVYVAYLPTMILWSGAYALGAGLGLGGGSIVWPGSSTVGMLPAFPPLAAVPPGGTPFDWGWLAVGIGAGLASGAWFCRRDAAAGAPPRLTTWSWQAPLAGLGAATLWIVASWLSRGDLGTGRLVGLGPVFPALVWCTLAPLVLGAAAAGIASALLRARSAAAFALSDEVTEPVPLAVGAVQPGE